MDERRPDAPATPPGDGEAQARYKREAARAAVAEVRDGAVIGLGSGSTAELMVAALAERVRAGLRVTAVASSERTAALAASLGINLCELDEAGTLDLSIDGADEVLPPTLDLIKGRGGALLREKYVAAASRYRIIIVDVSKLVTTLGVAHPIPVEVEPFGWQHTARRLEALGAQAQRRQQASGFNLAADGPPFITDGGHYVLDCVFAQSNHPAVLSERMKLVTGVVDHGLFIGMTERVYVAGPAGIQRFDRAR